MNPTSVFAVTTSILYLIKTRKIDKIYNGLIGKPPSFVDGVIKGVGAKPKPTELDPNIIKFIISLFLVSILIEVVNRFSEGAAWTLALILILGFLFNNQYAILLINMGSTSLNEAVST